MTLFAACLRLLGLSQREAGEFLGVSRNTVADWATGRVKIPRRVWDEARALRASQMRAIKNRDVGVGWPSDGTRLAIEAALALDADGADQPVGNVC